MASDLKKILKAKQLDFEKEYNARLERCRPIAQKIIEIIAESNLPTGDLFDKKQQMKEDESKAYEETTLKILRLVLDSGVLYADRNFIFQLIFQPVEQIKLKVLQSIDRSFERADENKWGKDTLDITMDDIHQELLSIEGK